MWSVYLSPRVFPLLLLGFASGLPLSLTGSTLQAWLTTEAIDLKKIGLLTLVGSAYTLKFLWSPLIDRYAFPFLGRRRGWMFITQLALATTVAAMGFFDPHSQLTLIAVLACVVAFLSATQDIAFDAYSTDVLREPERAAGVGTRVLGYRIGMIASGGLALIAVGDWGVSWRNIYLLMGLLMAGCALVTMLAPEPEKVVKAPVTLAEAVVAPLKEFFARPEAITVLLLIVLYKLGDAFAGALSTSFLLGAGGYSPSQVGEATKIYGMIATIVGAVLGGSFMMRWGLYRSLLWFGLLQAGSNFGYWLVAVSPVNDWLMFSVIAVENLCGGMGTSAFVALLMALCSARFSAAQFALLSALSAVGRTYLAGPITPYIVEAVGWPQFFLITVLIALPGLFLLWWRRQHILALQQPSTAST